MSPGEGVSLARFLHVVGQLKFRGTSVLFRLPRCPVVKKVTKTEVREPSPVPGIPPGPTEQSENRPLPPSPKSEKKVVFVGLGQNSEGKGSGEDEMELGEGGGREEVDGEKEGREAVKVALDESLPLNLPKLKVSDDDERMEEGAVEERGFAIATHFVKVTVTL